MILFPSKATLALSVPGRKTNLLASWTYTGHLEACIMPRKTWSRLRNQVLNRNSATSTLPPCRRTSLDKPAYPQLEIKSLSRTGKSLKIQKTFLFILPLRPTKRTTAQNTRLSLIHGQGNIFGITDHVCAARCILARYGTFLCRQ